MRTRKYKYYLEAKVYSTVIQKRNDRTWEIEKIRDEKDIIFYCDLRFSNKAALNRYLKCIINTYKKNIFINIEKI